MKPRWPPNKTQNPVIGNGVRKKIQRSTLQYKYGQVGILETWHHVTRKMFKLPRRKAQSHWKQSFTRWKTVFKIFKNQEVCSWRVVTETCLTPLQDLQFGHQNHLQNEQTMHNKRRTDSARQVWTTKNASRTTAKSYPKLKNWIKTVAWPAGRTQQLLLRGKTSYYVTYNRTEKICDTWQNSANTDNKVWCWRTRKTQKKNILKRTNSLVFETHIWSEVHNIVANIQSQWKAQSWQ